jgi:hypothetical protein
MDGYYNEPVELGIVLGKLVQAVGAGKSYQSIATDDIGAFAALAFEPRKGLHRFGVGDRRQQADGSAGG